MAKKNKDKKDFEESETGLSNFGSSRQDKLKTRQDKTRQKTKSQDKTTSRQDK